MLAWVYPVRLIQAVFALATIGLTAYSACLPTQVTCQLVFYLPGHLATASIDCRGIANPQINFPIPHPAQETRSNHC